MADFTFSSLTPTRFLDRAEYAFRDRVAIVDGRRRFTYGEFGGRSRRLAGALAELGVSPGDRVAALCLNSHVMLELHNGVPLAGAVLVPLNIRLSPGEIDYILRHSGARVLVATDSLADRVRDVCAEAAIRLVEAGSPGSEYEALLAAAAPASRPCEDERGLLAISYTSGTTGRPKGVMYHHRGAYLQSLAMALHSGLGLGSQYLWTLPMFHCDGWCFTWAVTAAGATHVCLPHVDVAEIWRLVREEEITHLSAAPTVLSMIADAPAPADLPDPRPTIRVDTGGAPPSPTLLARLQALGMSVTHLYGLTETFGPVVINQWQPEWDALDLAEQATLKARQGIGNVVADRLRVVDTDGVDVPADGATIGELVCRGDDVMLGYYRDQEETEAASLNGWLRTGDLGVVHPDGYVEIRDRMKDVIISGGENIASVELERLIDSHPAVLESAVVAQPDDKWGEVPVAFVALRADGRLTDTELVAYLRERIASFKLPRRVEFTELPKTSTGKIRKNVLREQVRATARGGASPVASAVQD